MGNKLTLTREWSEQASVQQEIKHWGKNMYALHPSEAEHHGAFPNMGDGGGGSAAKFIFDSLGSVQPMSSNI